MGRKPKTTPPSAAPTEVCSKCQKPGHKPLECKASWKKAWPGRHVTKLGIRYPDGSWLEVTLPLPGDLGERLHAFLMEAIRQDGDLRRRDGAAEKEGA